MKLDLLLRLCESVATRSGRRLTKRLVAAPFAAALLLAATDSGADFLTNGDFQTSPLAYKEAYPVGDNLDKWIAYANQYTLETAGPSGDAADLYARHRQTGGGGDEKLVQFIAGSGITGKLALNLDYIYDESPDAQSSKRGRVSIVGISSVVRNYEMYGGRGTDGIEGGDDFTVAAPDVLLDQVELPYSDTWKKAVTLVADVAVEYAYIGVVVQSECFELGETVECDTLRGVDNFVLYIDEEGPYTKHVEGVPNAAIAGTPFLIRARVDDTETGNSTIDSAYYRILDEWGTEIDDGDLDPTDGAFDMPFEDVSGTHGGLAVGKYQICVTGYDVVGNEGDESCSNFVTYNPISESGLNIPISNQCAIFYTLENPGAENEIRTLQYGEAIVFDTNLRFDLDLGVTPSGNVKFHFGAKANGQGTGVTSGILYNFVLNSVLRAKTDLNNYDPSTFEFNIRAKIVGQAQEIDGYGILNGAQNNAELLFKLRLHYANGSFTHTIYDSGVECVGDPWSNLMENNNLETREPVTRGFGDDWNKYAWAGADFRDALIVATKNAYYDLNTYLTGDGDNSPGGITYCINNPPSAGGLEYPEVYWRFACMEIYGDADDRDTNGAQIWRFDYKNKRWQLVYDAIPTYSPPQSAEYIQGFRDAVVHKGKLYVAADRGAFISGVSYETFGYFPGVAILVSADGINFTELTSCPAGLCGGQFATGTCPGAPPGPPVPTNNVSIRALASLGEKLMIGTLNNCGGEIWSYSESGGFSATPEKKFDATYPIVGELEPYDNRLWIGLGGNLTVDDGSNNDYLWDCSVCTSGADDFAPVDDLPDIDPDSLFVIKLFEALDKLFVGTVNFENGFSFLSYDKNAAAGAEWDVIVDGPNDGGMFDPFNIYLWSGAGEINGRVFVGTFNPNVLPEFPRSAELWYSDDGVNWTQYPMPIGWSVLGYGIRNMVIGDRARSLFLLSATNMVAPDLVPFDNPLRAGLEVWQIRDNKVASPSGGAKKGKGGTNR